MNTTSPILVFVPRLTNRLGYTLNVLLHTFLHYEYRITLDPDTFRQHTGPRFSYGTDQPLADEPHFRAVRLLFETAVAEQELGHALIGDTHTLFPVPQPSALPFDPFAASFFMLSRYEEHLPFTPDLHDRFPTAASAAHRHGFLLQAVVDRWAALLRDTLVARFPELAMPAAAPEFNATVDVDAAFCYLHKGILRTCRGFLLDAVVRHSRAALRHRAQVVFGKQPDPYDTFDYILSVANNRPSLKLTFFILLGDYSVFDKPIPHTNRQFRQLLQHLGDYAKLGVHPSYYCLDQPELVDFETQRLSDILHRTIVRSRFHFLRFRFPQSFQTLIDAGLRHDFSLCYPDTPGYRAGTGTPFPFFDLTTNQELPLTLHPFIFADSPLTDPDPALRRQAEEQYQALVQETRRNAGTMATLWHNQHLAPNQTAIRHLFEHFAALQ